MAKQVLGKVMMTFKGTYDSATSYDILDVVNFEGSTYISKKETLGNEPTNDEYWALLVERPIKGIDYFTDEEKEEFVASITEDANSVFNQNVDDKMKEYNDNAKNKMAELNTNFTNKTNELNENVTNQISSIDSHVEDKITEISTHVADKTTEFDTHVTGQTTTFDNHVAEQTTDFDTNANNQTISFNENAGIKKEEYDTNADNRMNEYNTQAEELLNYAENMDNIVPKNEVNGELVQIDDTLNYKLFGVEAESTDVSKQETTSGKNLCGIPDQTISTNGINILIKGGLITLDGTVSDNGVVYLVPIQSITLNGNYTFNNIFVSGTLDKGSGDSNGNANIRKKANKNIISGASMPLDATNRSIKISIEDTEIIYGLYLISGNVYENYCFRLQLVEGSSSDFEYEPYTGGQPSPNPDYPQEIETVNEATINICGKNWFENEWESGEINLNTGIRNDNGNMICTKNYIKILPNVQYTLSRSIVTGYDSLRFYDKDKNYLGYQLTIPLETNLSSSTMDANVSSMQLKILDENVAYMRINDSSGDTSIKYQLELGDKVTSYEEYKGTSIPIDLQGNEIVKLSDDVKDVLQIDKKSNVSLIKNIGKYIFNGDEEANLQNDGKRIYVGQNNNPNMSKPINPHSDSNLQYFLSCNYLATVTPSNTWAGVEGISYDINDLDGKEGFCIAINKFTTLQEYKDFFKDKYDSKNSFVVYYILKTPEVINLGNLSELIKTFSGTNNIWIESNLGTTIDLVYAQDLKLKHDKEVSNLQSQIDELKELVNTLTTSTTSEVTE